jgi:hypothetical protein
MKYDTTRQKLEHERGILQHLNDPSVKAAEASCCVSLASGLLLQVSKYNKTLPETDYCNYLVSGDREHVTDSEHDSHKYPKN